MQLTEQAITDYLTPSIDNHDWNRRCTELNAQAGYGEYQANLWQAVRGGLLERMREKWGAG